MQIQSFTCDSSYYLTQRPKQYFPGPENIIQATFHQTDRFDTQSTTSKNVHFRGKPQLPSKLKVWLHKVAPWFQHTQNPMLGDFPLKFRSSTIIPDGTIVPFTLTSFGEPLKKSKLTEKDIAFAEPETVINILVDKRIDKYLLQYLNSVEVKQLAKKIPDKKATVDEEIAFLEQLGALTKQQFSYLNIPPEIQRTIQDLDNFPQQTKSQREHYEKLYPMKSTPYDSTARKWDKNQPLRLLGESMRRGIGVCCHQALLNKITLDYIK